MQELSSLRERFTGEIVLPGDPGYDSARAVWNGMIDRRPAIVLRPTDAGGVATAIAFAREQELAIAVKSGGHSIPGLSTCDDGAVIDLSRMRGVQVDPERRVAQVNGGSLLGELDERAQSFALVCPVGVVGHTGVAGLTLGGGMGRLQRRFGLTIDNLLSVELVTADGQLVRASEKENGDLFWGLRGAGANFGIVTSFEFRLHPLDGAVTHGTVTHPIERATELASIFRETEEAAPDELWLGFGLGLAAGEPVATVQVLHCGRVAQAERDLEKLRAFGPPLADTIEAKPYLVPQGMNDDAMRWGHRFYMKSGFIPDLPEELIALLVEHMGRVPDGADGGVSFWAMGGAIAEVPEDATAFTGREAAFWIAAEILWDDEALDDRCRNWTRALMDDALPFTSAGHYVNDVAEAGQDPASIYGAEKYERLVLLKQAWDPENVFRFNQNVRPEP
ncbi:MAG TPA: FAD-binding oxidoreductase [Gaiellaceae bacterium]|nr:FAD-binding oxidoreductase [Gaiellaceae bacterium]